MATIAVFLALGGGTYAARHLGKNSVGTKQLKNSAVSEAKIADGAVTQSKISGAAQSALRSGPAGGALNGNFPNPRLAPAEQVHELSNSDFGSCHAGSFWRNENDINANFPKIGYYRDPYGVVHLRGALSCPVTPDDTSLFTLPPGYAPPLAEIFPGATQLGATTIQVTSQRHHDLAGPGPALAANQYITLDGISFRCEPSGVSGCP